MVCYNKKSYTKFSVFWRSFNKTQCNGSRVGFNTVHKDDVYIFSHKIQRYKEEKEEVVGIGKVKKQKQKKCKDRDVDMASTEEEGKNANAKNFFVIYVVDR